MKRYSRNEGMTWSWSYGS